MDKLNTTRRNDFGGRHHNSIQRHRPETLTANLHDLAEWKTFFVVIETSFNASCQR